MRLPVALVQLDADGDVAANLARAADLAAGGTRRTERGTPDLVVLADLPPAIGIGDDLLRTGIPHLVAALRETSIVIGAVIGTLFLGERFGWRRTVAAVIVLVGIVIVDLTG